MALALTSVGCAAGPALPSALVNAGATLRPLPVAGQQGRAELVLSCQPADAEVSLEGVAQGTCDDFDGAPRGLQLGPGPRRVVVKKAGYSPWESWVDASHTRVVMTVTLVANEETKP